MEGVGSSGSRVFAAVLMVLAAAPVKADPPLKYTALFGDAAITAVAVDAAGTAYVTGAAYGPLPVTPGAFQTDYRPAICHAHGVSFPCPVAFAAKLSPDGTALVYLTYLGSSNCGGTGISVDGQGNAWIAGWIGSADLPVTPGAFQSTPKFNPDSMGGGFVLKLNAAGSHVLYASYFGGSSGANLINAQALDSAGSLYVGGNTGSADFPVTSGRFQTDPGEARPSTGFLAKFDRDGKLAYSTYLHGSSGSTTSIASIAVDASGNAYATGVHTGGSLPVTAGAFQTSAGSPASTAFAAKLDATGAKLVYCTYLNAASPGGGSAIAVDPQGNAFVGGIIDATIPGALGSLSSGFINKLNPAGSALTYSAYLEASDFWAITAVAVDPAGQATVVGATSAADLLTTPGALFQCKPSGSSAQVFVYKLAADGSKPVYSTYLGMTSPPAFTLGSSGELYIAGYRSTLPVVAGSFGWTGAEYESTLAALTTEPLPVGSVSCVASAASRDGAAIAPGEIVDIFGNGIGPPNVVSASTASGLIPTSLGGVQVMFGDFPAPLLLADPNRIRAIVPFETGPAVPNVSYPLEVQILSSFAPVQPFATTLVSLTASVFTAEGKPTGQALMINQDGTPNSAANPAAQGSIVTIYATGLNNTDPPLVTGAIAAAAAPLALSSHISVTVGKIVYAGAAPGFPAGLTQINIQLPPDGPRGAVPLYLMLPGFNGSQPGVYFYQRGAIPSSGPPRGRHAEATMGSYLRRK
jgi:uncharacterized protein (TIGR03437 family)